MMCPDCNGSGYYVGITHYDMEGGGAYNEFVKRQCGRCEGSGEVCVEMSNWIEIGKRIRKARRGRRETQRVAARRMGLTIAEYRELESGRIDPELYKELLHTAKQ